MSTQGRSRKFSPSSTKAVVEVTPKADHWSTWLGAKVIGGLTSRKTLWHMPKNMTSAKNMHRSSTNLVRRC
ncbi:hypothetical protein LguiA_017855 [Lonicera macranthoides]